MLPPCVAALAGAGSTPAGRPGTTRTVDWAAADLVAVRSTWDYTERAEEFLAWARAVDGATRLLNGAEVFAWNADKGYLAGLGGVPVVPTRTADHRSTSSRPRSTGSASSVVKPRVGAGGGGVIVVEDPADRAWAR